MNYLLSQRAQDEICEELIKKFAGIYYSYKPVDIIGFAKYLGLDLRYVTFCDDLTRLGFYSDGETPVMIMTKRGPKSKVFPKNTVLISDSLRPEEKKNKQRFTIAHEVTHYIRCLMSGKPAEAAYMTDYESTDDISATDLKRLMNTEEKMADRGAAALLMPRKLVVNTCRSVMNDQPIKVYGEDNFDEDTLIKLQEIADFMQVSVMALTIRLKTLRLLEKHSIDEYEGFAIILGGVPE